MKRPALTSAPFEAVVLCGISPPFGRLSPARGNITHVLLTRAPLYRGRSPFSCDLHVLGAPLTFVLSQDQTLQLNLSSSRVVVEPRLHGRARALALEYGESLRSLHRLNGGRRPRALRETHSSSFRAHPEGRVRNAIASVRFSFQGPREPEAPNLGAVTLVARVWAVKEPRSYSR
jgi:hypothetical protein